MLHVLTCKMSEDNFLTSDSDSSNQNSIYVSDNESDDNPRYTISYLRYLIDLDEMITYKKRQIKRRRAAIEKLENSLHCLRWRRGLFDETK